MPGHPGPTPAFRRTPGHSPGLTPSLCTQIQSRRSPAQDKRISRLFAVLLRPLDPDSSIPLPPPSRCPGGRPAPPAAQLSRPGPAAFPAQPTCPCTTPPRSQRLLAALTSVSRTEELTKLLPRLVKTGRCQRGGGWWGRGRQGGRQEGGGAGREEGGGRRTRGEGRDLSPEKPLASDSQRLGRQAGPAWPRASLGVRSQHVPTCG